MSTEQHRQGVRITLLEGERLATESEVEEFWTEERLEVAKQVYQGVSLQLKDLYGGHEIREFSPSIFELVMPEGESELRRSGVCNHLTGVVGLVVPEVGTDRQLAQVIAHEVGEMRSRRLDNFFPEFAFIDEAVIEITSSRLLYLALPRVKDDPDPVTYSNAREAVVIMCKRMSHALDDRFYYPHEVFQLLQRAVFAGEHEEFVRAFLEVYGGEEGFEVFSQLTNFGESVHDKAEMKGGKFNNLRHELLKQFLAGEAYDLDGLTELERVENDARGSVRYEINGKVLVIDYSLIDADVQVGVCTYLGKELVGVRGMVEEFLSYFDGQLQGVNAIKTPKLSLDAIRSIRDLSGKDFPDRGGVRREAYELLRRKLGFGGEPSFVVDRIEVRRRDSYYEVKSLGQGGDGRKAYIVVGTLLRKSRGVEEYGPVSFSDKVVRPRVLGDEELRELIGGEGS